jgi:hypothetical protein
MINTFFHVLNFLTVIQPTVRGRGLQNVLGHQKKSSSWLRCEFGKLLEQFNIYWLTVRGMESTAFHMNLVVVGFEGSLEQEFRDWNRTFEHIFKIASCSIVSVLSSRGSEMVVVFANECYRSQVVYAGCFSLIYIYRVTHLLSPLFANNKISLRW